MKPAQWFGSRISSLMKLAGLTQAGVAELSGVERTYISLVVNGKTNFSVGVAVKLIEACGYELVELRVRKKNALSDVKSFDAGAAGAGDQ